MKIILFDETFKKLDDIAYIQEAKPLGLHEVTWQGGGATFQSNYIVLEDTKNFEDLSQEDILAALKSQARLSNAIKFKENEVYYISDRILEAEKTRLENSFAAIDAAVDFQNLNIIVKQYAANIVEQ